MKEIPGAIAPTLPPSIPGPASSVGAPVALDTVSDLLRGLDSQQRRAVTHRDGAMLVVAGPGTGKTRVVTHRIAWLIATKRARPSQILALTYTDKAADEMQARVDLLVPYGQADAAIHTFHAFGDRLLREFGFELGLAGDLRILTRAECLIFLRERMFDLGLDHYLPLGDPTRFLDGLLGLFGRAKDEGVTPAGYEAYASDLLGRASRAASPGTVDGPSAEAEALAEGGKRQAELGGVYGRYVRLMAEAGCIDFGDQVTLAVRLLREHPAVRAEIQRRHRYVIVDEFQDTNPVQLQFLELLAGSRRSVTVVGDDDQSIYAFRGAALSNILDFGARFGGARRIVLRGNHRSRAPILDAAYRLVRHNDPFRLEAQGGFDKRPTCRRRTKRPAAVRHICFGSVSDEADGVASAIAERVSQGAAPAGFAILVRNNADADPFLRSLTLRGLPWRFSGASGLYGRAEVRELVAFLRVVANPDSTVDLYGLATGEPYGMGGVDLTQILQMARRRHRSLWSLLCELDAQPGILRVSGATRTAVSRLVADLAASQELSHRRSAGEVLYDHLKRSGRLARLAAAPDGDECLQNVARFFDLVRRQSHILAEDRVPFLVPHLDTLIKAGDDPASASLADDDAVSVLTVHRAKGLEFPVVFMVGLVDGRFPSTPRRGPLELPDALRQRAAERHSAEDGSALAEERRLFYVAMTRARDELVLSHAAQDGGGRPKRPSIFIAEALDRPAAMLPTDPGLLAPLDRLANLAPIPSPTTELRPSSADERLNLSFSQLDDYLTCPLKYKLRHVVGVPVPPHHALAYGTAMHHAVAAFHGAGRRGRIMTEDELLAVLNEHWASEGYLSRQHEEVRYAAARSALLRFRSGQLAEAVVPAAVEQEFSFSFGRDRIRGRFDRVDATPDGVVITDYKSSDVREQAKADQKARESLQLAIYGMAHEAETGTLPHEVQLHFLDSGVIGRARLDQRRLERARHKIAAAAEGIRARSFAAKPGYISCGYCPFRDICPEGSR